MKYFPILIFLLCSSLISKAQTNTILGQVIDADTGEPLGFCNVGWVNLSKGTVSDQVGRFRLEMGPENSDHLLKISKMGYKTLEITSLEIFKNCTMGECPMIFELSQNAIDLPEYTFEIIEKNRNMSWGKTNRRSIFGLAFNPKDRKPSENLGREMAIELDTKGKIVKLQTYTAKFSMDQFEKSLFRINLYQLLENETYDLLPQNGEILHELTQEMGSILEVDLTPYEIIVNGKYLIGLEWISYEDQVNSGILTISTSYPFGKTLMKNSSHDQWVEIKGAPSIQVDGALLIQD